MAHSLKFLLSPEAAEMRLDRLEGNIHFNGENKFVVHIEVSSLDDDRLIEFDAVTHEVAMARGYRWLANHNAITFAVRMVKEGGSLSKPLGIYDDVELGLVENYI